jgi:hypothetical protein
MRSETQAALAKGKGREAECLVNSQTTAPQKILEAEEAI